MTDERHRHGDSDESIELETLIANAKTILSAPNSPDGSDYFPKSNARDELEVLSMVKALAETDDSTFNLASQYVKNVASHAATYDFIVVTGNSGSVSQALLEAAGIPKEKFIVFDHEINLMAKLPRARDLDQTITLDERNRVQERTIEQRLKDFGLDFSPGKVKPTVCVVDEYVQNGQKAISYIGLFSRLSGIRDFSFATFDIPQTAVGKTPSVGFQSSISEYMRRNEIQNRDKMDSLVNGHFFSHTFDYDQNAHNLFFRLSGIASMLNRPTEVSHLSQQVTSASRIILQNALTRFGRAIAKVR